jgi:hypothetical protein
MILPSPTIVGNGLSSQVDRSHGVRPLALVPARDAGCQYTSFRYSDRLARAGIAMSIGSVVDSYDNAMAEAPNGTFKAELVKLHEPWPRPRGQRDDGTVRRRRPILKVGGWLAKLLVAAAGLRGPMLDSRHQAIIDSPSAVPTPLSTEPLVVEVSGLLSNPQLFDGVSALICQAGSCRSTTNSDTPTTGGRRP